MENMRPFYNIVVFFVVFFFKLIFQKRLNNIDKRNNKMVSFAIWADFTKDFNFL